LIIISLKGHADVNISKCLTGRRGDFRNGSSVRQWTNGGCFVDFCL
jgi:hypothetical protein